jgi:hypothetical protein
MRLLSCTIVLALLCLATLPSCVHHNNHSLKISVEESTGTYTFYASFPEDKTGKIHRLINNSMSPNGLFASVNDYMDVTTTLQDKTTFAVKASPGIIRIKVDREGNSPASYNRIKDMCAAIKRSLKE